MSRRSELAGAAAWGVLGAVILVASWRMDRLADRGINPWSAPGLTPGVVGGLMILLALALALQSGREREPSDGAASPGSLRRTLLAVVLCVGFAGFTLGHGLPFVVEGAAFVFVFATLFSLPLWREQGRGMKSARGIECPLPRPQLRGELRGEIARHVPGARDRWQLPLQ